MKDFEAVVGAALIALSFITLAIWIVRAKRRIDLDGIQFVYFSNLGMGLFLLAYGRSWSTTFGHLVLIASGIIGFGSGVAVLVSLGRASKDPFR